MFRGAGPQRPGGRALGRRHRHRCCAGRPVRRFLCPIRFIAIASSFTTRASIERAGGAIIVNDDDDLGANLAREIPRAARRTARCCARWATRRTAAVPADAAQKIARVCFEVAGAGEYPRDAIVCHRSAESPAPSAFHRHRRRRHERDRGVVAAPRIRGQRMRSERWRGRRSGSSRSAREIDTGHHPAHIASRARRGGDFVGDKIFQSRSRARSRDENSGHPARGDAGRAAADGARWRRGRRHSRQDHDDRSGRP